MSQFLALQSLVVSFRFQKCLDSNLEAEFNHQEWWVQSYLADSVQSKNAHYRLDGILLSPSKD